MLMHPMAELAELSPVPAGGPVAGGLHPCSQSQQRFVFEEHLHPGNPGLNVAVRWRLEGVLSGSHLTDAWRQLAARHAALRTAFSVIDGEPVQLVKPHLDVAVKVVDLRGLAPAERPAEAERLATAEARTLFDITVAPLFRVTRLITGDATSTLLFTAHHVICDGWSIGILARDMGHICTALQSGAEPELPPLAVSYADYAAWERTCMLVPGAADAQTAYARALLKGHSQFELLPDFPRPPIQTANGNITSLLLRRELTDGLARIARANGCTLFVGALCALLTLLHRYTGESDITLGTQVAGRDDEALENIVGCFINTIVLRGDVHGNPTFVELLERMSETVADAFEMRHVPLERLIEAVKPKRDLSRNALFSVNFIFQRSFITNATYGDFALVDLPSRSAGALYDLNFFMVERPEGWRVSCEYNTDLFALDTIEALLARFCNVVTAVVVSDPAQPLARIAVLDSGERLALVAGANATHVDYPINDTLPRVFAAQAARTPNAVALAGVDRTLTYAQLDAAANRLARELVARGVRRGMRVGVLLGRSSKLVVALLAVLKTGAAYVPLDPTYPRERLAYIVGDAQLGLVITRAAFADRLRPSDAFMAVDLDADAIAANSDARFDGPSAAADVAYVIYTSGSTGQPKGVAVGHQALLNFLFAMRERPGISANDTLVAVTTISFDIAALELYLPLISGATVVIAAESEVGDGPALLRLLQRSRATIVQATPVTWQLLIDAGWRGEPALTMLCGGEALSRSLAEQLLDRGTALWNMYGPTETTIWSAVSRVERGDGPVFIGPPIANTQFYVLDRAGDFVPPGAPGELYIGGDGVAHGYFERAELNRQRFVPDGFRDVPGARLYRTGDIVRARKHGEFEFLGRTDHQIKLRGFRIELGEIEAALLRQPDVAEAVASVSGASAQATLRAFVVAKAGTANAGTLPAVLRAALAQTLPAYMIPAPIVVIDALPRTLNGKIDRSALANVEAQAVTAVADPPTNGLESDLAAIIGGLLECGPVGRNDDIFGLGFHSLLALRLVNAFAQRFGTSLSLRTLFDHPTVAGLAQHVAAPAQAIPPAAPAPPSDAFAAIHASGGRTPFFFFHNDLWAQGLYCRRLAATTGPTQPFYAVAPHGCAELPVLPTIEAMARDYLGRLRAVQPHGPYRIGGFCAGGLVAYELARLLHAQGETVERLILLNASTPPRRAVFLGDDILRAVGLNARLNALARERICWNVVRLFDAIGYGPRPALRFVGRRWRALRGRADDEARRRNREVDLVAKRRGTVDTERYFANLIAAYTYHPEPYDGDVVLIWGSDQAGIADPTTGWGALARSVRVVPLAGSHLSLIRDGVDRAAAVIDTVLRAPESGPHSALDLGVVYDR